MKVFAVADAKTRDEKIPWNSDLIKLYFGGNVTSFFLAKLNVKLQT